MRNHSKCRQLRRLRIRNIILNTLCSGIALAGAVFGIRIFLRHHNYDITNDAYVDQYIVPINVRVSGYVSDVYFTEHQYVHKGDTLLIIDNREYSIKLEEAQARLMDAEGMKNIIYAEKSISDKNISVVDAKISEAESELWQCRHDLQRYERLLDEESVSRHQYEKVKTEYDTALARLTSLRRQKEAAVLTSREKESRVKTAEAMILQRQAEVDMAELNLTYTIIRAPFNGYIGQRTLEHGQYIQAGQSISNLTRDEHKWITAHYLESQITNIHLGQRVKIKIDAYSEWNISGIVTAISEATGSKYSRIPIDNSAGNFVKVQQRIPVRIDIDTVFADKMKYLRAGMMVETAACKTE